MDDLVTRRIANCPTPEYHETHRYCPSCPWTEPQEPKIVVVDELPPRLEGAVKRWLEINQRAAVDVKHGVFPLGMVQRHVERSEENDLRRSQKTYLYDQWGFRIIHCSNREPHKWHGWVGGNEDLRCPGVPEATS